jgi:hypothetical protein
MVPTARAPSRHPDLFDNGAIFGGLDEFDQAETTGETYDRLEISTSIEQHFEMLAAATSLPGRSKNVVRRIRCGLDFRREIASQTAKRLHLLPPLTWASDT